MGDECGIGEWGFLGSWAGGGGAGWRWKEHVLQLSPSCLQPCVKEILRAQKTRCACGQESAAAVMATLVPTATLVSAGLGGVGCWTACRETREITRRQIGARLALGGWLWQSRGWGVCRLITKLSPRPPDSCRVPAPVLGPRLQGEVQLSPSRTVRGRDRTVYVSRAPLGCALRACVPVPAWHVPPAERRVPLRARLVGCTMR